MIKEKVIFIIPGFNHLPINKAYVEIARMMQNDGYHPIIVTIPWKNTTISQNTEYFIKEFKKIDAKKKYILGFSFGAMIAFIASTKVDVYGLVLCSLSPYFKEDLPELNSSKIPSIQLQQHQDFSTLHCATLAKRLKAKQILMTYGTEEEKSLIKRVKQAYSHIPSRGKQLISIAETDHNIGDKRYLYKIHQIAKVLN